MTSTAPIAYLASEYPALSHTFIQREIAGVRATGQDVLTASLRRTSGAHIAGEAEAAEARQTFYVIETGKRPGSALAALGWALKRPGRLGRALSLVRRIRAPGAKAALWQVFHLVEAMVLARHLEAQGVRHLHCHFENAGCTVAMLTSALSGIPFSFTLHGPSIFFEPHRQGLGEKIAEAQFVACISHFARSQGMIFADRTHWDKMEIVHCGVEPARYGRTAQPDGQHLVFVGRLAAVKGVAMLLRAVAALMPDYPDLRLTLVGDGPERTSLEALAGDLGVGDVVTFAGARTQAEVAETLAMSDLFVLPSFAEGVPVVLMEAMASRLPVITTRIAGIPELVEDGVSGRLVPPGHLQSLIDAIRDLLADPDLRMRMGQAGRAKVETDYDIRKEAEKIAALFNGGGNS